MVEVVEMVRVEKSYNISLPKLAAQQVQPTEQLQHAVNTVQSSNHSKGESNTNTFPSTCHPLDKVCGQVSYKAYKTKSRLCCDNA